MSMNLNLDYWLILEDEGLMMEVEGNLKSVKCENARALSPRLKCEDDQFGISFKIGFGFN